MHGVHSHAPHRQSAPPMTLLTPSSFFKMVCWSLGSDEHLLHQSDQQIMNPSTKQGVLWAKA